MLLNTTLQFCFAAETIATYEMLTNLNCWACDHALNKECCYFFHKMDNIPLVLTQSLSTGVTGHSALLRLSLLMIHLIMNAEKPVF